MGVSDDIKPKDEFSYLEVNINYTLSKRFLERKSDITAFRITLIFLFPDFKNNRIKTIPFVLPDKILSDYSLYSFIVTYTAPGKFISLLFQSGSLQNGEIQQNTKNAGIAMCLLASGMRD